MLWSRNKSAKRQQSTTLSIGFDRAGRSYLAQFANNIKKTPVGVTLLELAWTAGPVTFIALQSGHLLGFGNVAPVKNVIYFASYTLIAGFIGIGIRLIRRPLVEQKVKDIKENFSTVTDLLFDVIIASNDIELRNYESDKREIELLRILLSKPLMDATTIYRLSQLASNNDEFSRVLFLIATYRKNGFFSMEAATINENRAIIEQAIFTLKKSSPLLCAKLHEFIEGKRPSFKHGIERPFGFIDRVLTAGAIDDISTVTMQDTEAVFVLSLELLHGRIFNWYECKATHHRSQNELIIKTRKLRNKIRHDIAKFYSLLHSIAYLNKCDNELTFHRECIRKDASQTYQLILANTENLVKRIRNHVFDNATDTNTSLVNLLYLLRKIYKQYTKLYIIRNNLDEKIKILRKLQKQLATKQKKNKLSGLYQKIKIQQHNLLLSEKQRYHLSKELFESMDNLTLVEQIKSKPTFILSQTSAKHLAIDICSTLDELFNISDTQLQRAIENTSAAALNATEFDNSSEYRAGLAKSLIMEANQHSPLNLKSVIHAITNIYQIPINHNTKKYLAKKFDLSLSDVEEELKKSTNDDDNLYEDAATLPHIQVLPKHWERYYKLGKAYMKSLQGN